MELAKHLRKFPAVREGETIVLTLAPDTENSDDVIRAVAEAIGTANPHLEGKMLLVLPSGTRLRRVSEEVMRRAGWVRATS